MSENLAKMDELFDASRETEVIAPAEAMQVLGTIIRKSAEDETQTEDAKAAMQRGYLLAKCVEQWAHSDTEGDEIVVPVGLLEAVRKDGLGDRGNVIPISEAMQAIGKKFGAETSTETERTGTEKSDAAPPEPWAGDLNDEDAEVVDWGADPEGL